MINVASKAWLILFLNFAFWYEIFMSASPQPGKKNLTFDFFFFNKQRQEVHANWNALFILDFYEKSKGGGGSSTSFFKKP